MKIWTLKLISERKIEEKVEMIDMTSIPVIQIHKACHFCQWMPLQVKQYHRPDCNAFDVFGRVMSGTVFRGDRVKILGSLAWLASREMRDGFKLYEPKLFSRYP